MKARSLPHSHLSLLTHSSWLEGLSQSLKSSFTIPASFCCFISTAAVGRCMHSCFGCQLKVLRALEGAGSFRADMRFVSRHDTGKEACCRSQKCQHSSHKDGGCLGHDSCKCHCFWMLQMSEMPTLSGMVLVRHQRGNHSHHGGKGQDQTDLNKSSMLNCYRLKTIPYRYCCHQADTSLLRGDSNCNCASNCRRRKTTHTIRGTEKI